MIKYQLFPRSIGLNPSIKKVIDCFVKAYGQIGSEENTLTSNEVLAYLRPYLEAIDYRVERSKQQSDKIEVPVLFGENNEIDKCYIADALSKDGKIVIEVEAGRATENNQYMKDIFEASMMFDVEYLVLAVRLQYRTHFDYELIYKFLETLYISRRITLPLKGILLIGY